MSEHMRHLIEHLPFVAGMAANGRISLDWNQMIGALLVGGISAVGGSQITTARLEERVSGLRTDYQNMQEETRRMQRDYQQIIERMVICEANFTAALTRPGQKRH